MISEEKIIELAKICGSESDNKHDDRTTYEFDKKALMQFANALNDEFVKSLGEPYLYEYMTNNTHYNYVSLSPLESDYDEGSLVKLYALPNDDKPITDN